MMLTGPQNESYNKFLCNDKDAQTRPRKGMFPGIFFGSVFLFIPATHVYFIPIEFRFNDREMNTVYKTYKVRNFMPYNNSTRVVVRGRLISVI